MGYTTDFFGEFKLDEPLTPEHAAYLKKFNETRRMKRDEVKAAKFSDPLREAVGLPVGPEGGYYVNAMGYYGQEGDASVLDYNNSPQGQPGLWCKWTPTKTGDGIQWDGGEKFYDYVEWLKYLIDHFLALWGYTLNGEVKWRGEDPDDYGLIVVKDNTVTIREGQEIYQDTRNFPGLSEVYELLDLNQDDLDYMVLDKKGDEAANINNAGNVAQIAYLTGTDEAAILKIISARS